MRGGLFSSTGRGRRKWRPCRRTRFPFAFVSIRGRARIEHLSPAELLPWTTRLSRRYVGADRAADYGRRNAVEGGVLVRVSLDHVLAEKDSAT